MIYSLSYKFIICAIPRPTQLLCTCALSPNLLRVSEAGETCGLFCGCCLREVRVRGPGGLPGREGRPREAELRPLSM